jgi:serine/threonine protein kinase
MLIQTTISTKSDVYSYGKVLLELIGGRRNFQLIVDGATQKQKNSYFPKVARKKMLEGRLMEMVDACLMNEHIKEDEVRVLASVAFLCIQESPELRPSMADVVDMLEGNLEVHLMPEHLMFGVNYFELNSQSTSLESNDDNTTQTADDDEIALFSNDKISICIQ